MTMTLTFNALSLTLGNRFNSPFTSTNYPRIRVNVPSFSRSFNGSVLADSIPYEAPHIWTVGVRLRPAEADKLRRMYSLWMLTRPFQYLLLDDKVDPIYEPGVAIANRTRAIVSGTAATVDASGLRYFSRFNALFTDTPEFSKDGAWVRCQFQLTEGVKLAP